MPRWNNLQGVSKKIQELKREAVLKEAGRAFSTRGYHNTSLDDVANALQISKGSLYSYVKDKEEILFECHKIGNAISARALEYGISQGGNGFNMLRNILLREIELLTSEFGAYSVLTEIDALRPGHRHIVAAERNRLVQGMHDIVKQGMADGSIRRVNSNIVLMIFVGAINWLPRWSTPGEMTPEELATNMTDILLSGVAPAKTPQTLPTVPESIEPLPSKAPRK